MVLEAELSEEVVMEALDKGVLEHIDLRDRGRAKLRALDILRNYSGFETRTLLVLGYAAERKRFNELARKLDSHYEKNRGLPNIFEMNVQFFRECYKELGVNY